MMDVLALLERRETGATIPDLVAQLKLPRTTIYRILNSLQSHDVVRRDDAGAYHLGRRLLALASHVAAGIHSLDLVALTTPVLERLSGELGEGAKLSVLDGGDVLVLAAVQGRRTYALSVQPGERMPIHAGAASKLLLAYQSPAEIEQYLGRELVAFTAKSITDPKRLKAELTRIRRLGWAQDKGEVAPSILAFAAPVFDRSGTLVGAISTPFLQGTEVSRTEEVRLATIAAGKSATAAIVTAE